MTTSPGTIRRQKRMGPAPFASFEDLSDEVRSRLESPEDKNVATSVVRLPGIREDLTPTTPCMTDRAPSPVYPFKGISIIGSASTAINTHTPVPLLQKSSSIKPPTPRIDISRASSSSHHDSRDSSPERELFDSHDPNSAKLGLGFKEDGALDLRSSTEELDFQEIPERRKSKARPQSPCQQEEVEYARKDSQCSDIVLLSISGRTSRLSSIGSQGSGQSRLSNASHISILSEQSGLSRSSSPHKLNLETSFCGTKPPLVPKAETDEKGTKLEAEDMEKVLLSRKHDPMEAIIAEGIEVEKPTREKPPRKTDIANRMSDIKITVDKPTCEINDTKQIKSRFVAESGVEYFYIPLKGPLPPDLENSTRVPTRNTGKQRLREVKSANYQSKSTKNNKSPSIPEPTPRCKSATPTPSPSSVKKEEAKYIRIKLKPDRCYTNEPAKPEELQKPETLELDKIKNSSNYIHENAKLDLIQNFSFKEPNKSSVLNDSSPKKPRDDAIAESNLESISPSPSVSRKSSFTSIFKSKEAILSPESPSIPCIRRKNTLTGIIKDVGDNLSIRSRSKSRDRDSHKSSLSTAPSSTESIDAKSKHKSVLSLFKSGKKDKIKSESENSSQETLPNIEGIGKVEFKFNEPKAAKTYYENPLDAASIRIPLHSPTYYEDVSIHDWKTSSQDSQETVIEAASKSVNAAVEPVTQGQESAKNNPKTNAVTTSSRQSSTSSENVVFSTKLGNSDEVFTTKLPKRLPADRKKDDAFKTEVNGIFEDICPTEDQNNQQQCLEEIKIVDCLLKGRVIKEAKVTNDAKKEYTSGMPQMGSEKEEFTGVSYEVKKQCGSGESSLQMTQLKENSIAGVSNIKMKCDNAVRSRGISKVAVEKPKRSGEVLNKIKKECDSADNLRDLQHLESDKENSIEAVSDQKRKDYNSPESLRETSQLGPDKENSIWGVPNMIKQGFESTETLREMPQLESDKDNFGDKRISQMSASTFSNMSSMADEDRNSSESEREPEENINSKRELDLNLDLNISEPEWKAIFLQEDSFEDELPYIPTTLPMERSSAVPIVPVKQRSTFEIKTFPIERPRSTTPINPSCLEEYCEEVMGSFNAESFTKSIEKLKISLPRNESFDKTSKLKSPRKMDSNTKLFEFTEKGKSRLPSDVPPPLPPKGVQKAWINFEDIPEKRKAPKRIQTIPSRSYIEVPDSVLQDNNVLYNYVNPEECKCECHELNSKDREKQSKKPQEMVQEDELPLLGDENSNNEKNGPGSSERLRLDVAVSDCRSVISDSSADLSASIDHPEAGCKDSNLRTPFTSDLGISSNRSSIVSQDEQKSPESPNAFPKIT